MIDDKPDAIINIIDASNIERNLYLTTQILELGIPTVIALNMIVNKYACSIVGVPNKLINLIIYVAINNIPILLGHLEK